MIVAVTSVKGSPGATSVALAMAACWPRPVVVVEADPHGGDLAYRCRGEDQQPIGADRGLVSLAAEVRGGRARPELVASHAVRMANGVALVQGVTGTRQAVALTSLWPGIIDALLCSSSDVIVDLGQSSSGGTDARAVGLLRCADLVLVVAVDSLESVMHLAHGLPELIADARTLRPVLVTQGTDPQRDCDGLDQLLEDRGTAVGPSIHVPFDAQSLVRLERGEAAQGRLARMPLVRRLRQVVSPWVPDEPTPSADQATSRETGRQATPASRWLAPRTDGSL